MRRKDIMLFYKKTFKTLKELNSAKEGLKLGVELSKDFETVRLGDKSYIVADADRECCGCIQIQPDCHFYDFTGTLNQELREQMKKGVSRARASHTAEERYHESRQRVMALLQSIKKASKIRVTQG